MAPPSAREVLRFCFLGSGRGSVADSIAVVLAWCFTSAILLFNGLFGLLLPDGNLFLRGAGTGILSSPLVYLYARARRAVHEQRTP